jgi:hypothetical protein
MQCATHPIIFGRVGEGGQKKGDDVKKINQLLKLANFLVPSAEDGEWNQVSEEALKEFYKTFGAPVLSYIEPNDPWDRLRMLAMTAGVVIPLPTGQRGASALSILFNTCRERQYPYGHYKGTKIGAGIDVGTHVVWGFEDRPGYAVVTGVSPKDFSDQDNPVALNCTSFANMVLSVWTRGNLHGPSYLASQQLGGFGPNLGERYSMRPVNDGDCIFDGFCFVNPRSLGSKDKEGRSDDFNRFCSVFERLDKGRVHYVGLGTESEGVLHDTVVYNGCFYECNVDVTPSVYSTPIRKRLERLRASNNGIAMVYAGPN